MQDQTPAREPVDITGAVDAVMSKIPGRSIALLAIGIVSATILLSYAHVTYAVGWLWTLALLGGGALAAVGELRGAGVSVPAVPEAFSGLAVKAGYTLLVLAHAIQKGGISLRALPWLAAAALLIADLYRVDHAGERRFNIAMLSRGYRPFVAIGAALAIVGLWPSWQSSSGFFSGGYESGYSAGYTSYYGVYSNYNFVKYYYPGWAISGRAQTLVIFVIAGLLALVIWAGFRRNALPAWARIAALATAGSVTAWGLVHLSSRWGVLVFLTGVAIVDAAVVMIALHGRESGRFDIDDVRRRLQRGPESA